jgi:hypothetical protein
MQIFECEQKNVSEQAIISVQYISIVVSLSSSYMVKGYERCRLFVSSFRFLSHALGEGKD